MRRDLYYRIQVVQIDVPPLRIRGNDILILAQHFLERCSARANRSVTGIVPEAARLLLSYAWPGNVRELQNCIEGAVALCCQSHITADDLPPRVSQPHRSEFVLPTDSLDSLVPMDEIERRYVLRVIELTAGNKSLAARLLGLNRKTLNRKLGRYAGSDK